MVMRRILVLFLAVSMACNAYGAIAVVDIDKVIAAITVVVVAPNLNVVDASVANCNLLIFTR